MTAKTYFEELSYALLRRELLPRSLEEDGLLQWSGTAASCVGSRRRRRQYDPTWVDTSRAKAALAQVTEAAGTVMEYMTLLENAPPLKADGLADGYRVLAEFNGTVLAGTETLLGAQFVTWARDYDRRGGQQRPLLHGGLSGRQGGLRPPLRPEWPGNGSLTGSSWRGCARRCRASSMERAPPPTSRSSNAGASWIRSQPSCRKKTRIRCRAKVRSLDSPCEGRRQIRRRFSLQELLVLLGLRRFFVTYGDSFIPQSGYCCGQKPTKNNEEDTHV